MRLQTNRIITGLILQALALVVWYTNEAVLYAAGWVAVLVLGIPLFIAGVVVMMRAGGSVWLRLVLSFWPAAIPLAVAGVKQAAVGLQWARVRTEVFLIPADYRGEVTVVFDDPQGAAPERENRAAVFRIPASGELHTRDHASLFRERAVNEAIDARREFYLVDKGGKRTRIELRQEGQPPEQVVVFWGVSYVLLETVNGLLEDSRFKYYVFSVKLRQ